MSGKNDKDPSHKRKNDKPCEGRRYAIPSPKFITALADSCGISGLSDENLSLLGEDVSYRLREILFNCTVHLRSNKEKKLRSYHVDRALPGGTERVYGFLSGGSANFLYASEADAYVYHDNLIDVDLLALALSNDKYIQMGEVFIRGVWFLPDEIQPSSEPPRIDSSGDSPALTPVSVDYYNKIAMAVLSKHEKLFCEAVNDLARNPKIAHVIPYFLNLLGEGIKGKLRGGMHCMRLLEMVRALTLNRHIYRDATVMVNELVTNLLLCALDPRIPSGTSLDDYELRATAADVLACVVKYWYRSNAKLLKDIVQKLGSVLLDGSSSLRSHYGALVTLCSLGVDALNYCLWPHLEQYLEFISTLGIGHETKELEAPLLDAAELLYKHEGKALLNKSFEGHSIAPERFVMIDRLLYSHFGDSLCARRPGCNLFTGVTSEGIGHTRSGDDSLSSSVIKDSVCNDFEMEYRNWTAIAKIPNRIVPLCDNVNSAKHASSQEQERKNSRKVDVRSVFEVVPKIGSQQPIQISSIRGVSPWPHKLRQRTLPDWRGQFQPPSLYQVKSCQVNCVGKLARKYQQQRNTSFDFSAIL
ncbi:TAF6-like RNA polymerase II p300/CBP-associated factor-associated factor 65 kDa subunit 6L isoform X1 [Anabrus simplex]|uniref:TAF6-like RNA polymerase II p300/CBP-associated factor-associated factor 65 kDa subunit 6L isoform X1 n=1 Tax=Anabrus simplex TaxID=316456 RepID=UPI0035A38F9D